MSRKVIVTVLSLVLVLTTVFSTNIFADETQRADQLQELTQVKKELKVSTIKIHSAVVKTKAGKPAVSIYIDKIKSDADIDGIEIFRSLKKNSGYGKKPYSTIKKNIWNNTSVKAGKTYYYKVRAYAQLDGKRYYTPWSNKAYRKVIKKPKKTLKNGKHFTVERITPIVEPTEESQEEAEESQAEESQAEEPQVPIGGGGGGASNPDRLNLPPIPEQEPAAACEHDWQITGIYSGHDENVPFCAIHTCTKCQGTKRESLEYSDFNLPIINIIGSLDGISKENKVQVKARYINSDKDKEYYATLKIQGHSAVNYPKKNYNIQFYEDETYSEKNKIKLVEDWGKQSKYTLKANYVDFSQARNVVSGRIYSDIVDIPYSETQKTDILDKLQASANNGVVDGYPALIFINGDFLGLYTINIPKDNWMFGMKGSTDTKAAIIMAKYSTTYTRFQALVDDIDEDNSISGFCLEFNGDDIKEAEIIDSFNSFIKAVQGINSKDSLYKNLDEETIQRAIDTMVFTWLMCAPGNVEYNIIYATYDGKTWFPSPYDMDDTWGINGDAGTFNNVNTTLLPSTNSNNMLWKKVYKYDPETVKARYAQLRQSALSFDSIQTQFANFIATIPQSIYESESRKWPNVNLQTKNNLEQILGFTQQRLSILDNILEYDEVK